MIRAMAKAKTTWKWRDIEFNTKKELFAHLAQTARSAVQGMPVDEVTGQGRQLHSVRIKVQVSLGGWPPPPPRKLPTARTASRASKPGKVVTPLEPVRLPKLKPGQYF
jgi:hypothetical protein